MFYLIPTFILFIVSIYFIIKSLVYGVTSVAAVERQKPQGQNNESMWTLVIIVGYFFAGLGVLIPIIHGIINKNYTAVKNLIFYSLLGIMTMIGAIVSPFILA